MYRYAPYIHCIVWYCALFRKIQMESPKKNQLLLDSCILQFVRFEQSHKVLFSFNWSLLKSLFGGGTESICHAQSSSHYLLVGGDAHSGEVHPADNHQTRISPRQYPRQHNPNGWFQWWAHMLHRTALDMSVYCAAILLVDALCWWQTVSIEQITSPILPVFPTVFAVLSEISAKADFRHVRCVSLVTLPHFVHVDSVCWLPLFPWPPISMCSVLEIDLQKWSQLDGHLMAFGMLDHDPFVVLLIDR